MKKKLISALLVVSMIATLCAGCGNNGGDSSESDSA